MVKCSTGRDCECGLFLWRFCCCMYYANIIHGLNCSWSGIPPMMSWVACCWSCNFGINGELLAHHQKRSIPFSVHWFSLALSYSDTCSYFSWNSISDTYLISCLMCSDFQYCECPSWSFTNNAAFLMGLSSLGPMRLMQCVLIV